MKKLIMIIIGIFLIGGCSTMEINNNKFISSRRPYLEAKISPDFKYLSHFQWEDQILAVNKSRNLRYKNNSYFFIPNSITRGMIPKYVYIKISEIETYFIEDLLTDDSYIDRDVLKLGWYSFQVGSRMVFPKITEDKQFQKLAEEGYTIPKCVLQRNALRRVSQNEKTIGITYGEDATLSGYACEKWKDQANFTDEQKNYISDFNKRALSAFEIIASD
ncbi:MAG: hypothetical protein A4E71_01759 [Smithella sp. PtaU1.Bin162]|nr:MAG: hypothetical protein A4E71_01759 [Smithella sp. PtaU1.Bin162]